MQQPPIIYKKGTVGHTIMTSPKRYAIMFGGRGSGRSFTGSLLATSWLTSEEINRIVVTRQFSRDIADSIYREVEDRLSDIYEYLEYFDLSKNLKISKEKITYKTNSLVPFGFQANSKDVKTKGKSLAKKNKLILEEAQDNKKEDFVRLDDSLRQAQTKICLLTNPPPKNHWIVSDYFDLEVADTPLSKNTFYIPHLKPAWEPEIDFFYKTYKDNPTLPDIIQKKYKNYGNPEHPSFDPDYFYTQICGYIPSKKQGLVFTNWRSTSSIVFPSCKLSYGLDLGFNHPTAFVLVGFKDTNFGTEIYVKELFYKTRLNISDLIHEVKTHQEFKDITISADSSRPEIIDELRKANINIVGAKKGKDSVNKGIAKIQQAKIFEVEGANITNELNNYSYQNSKDGILKDVPIDDYNHAIDAVRYAIENQTESTDLKNSLDILSRFT